MPVETESLGHPGDARSSHGSERVIASFEDWSDEYLDGVDLVGVQKRPEDPPSTLDQEVCQTSSTEFDKQG